MTIIALCLIAILLGTSLCVFIMDSVFKSDPTHVSKIKTPWVAVLFILITLLTGVVITVQLIKDQENKFPATSPSCLITQCVYSDIQLTEDYFEFTDKIGTKCVIEKIDINALAFQNSPDRVIRIYELPSGKYNIVVTKEDKAEEPQK